MRVLFLAWKNECHPLAGGSEVLVDRLASGLHARGHQVTLLCAGPTGEHEYEVVDAGTKMRQYVTDPIVVRRRFGDVDVIVDVSNGLAFYSPLWARSPVVALVNHIHTGMWQEWFSPVLAWIGSTFETRVMPRVYRDQLIVAVSRSTASSLRDLGIPPEHVRVVHNGVDLPTALVDRSPEPTFVAVGRLVPHKRFDLMLRAWERVRPETGGTLVIAGEGPLREELEAAAPAGTVFVGHISDDERDALLARAWFLVQPSRLEGWGLVVMEAAACGTPTIGFRVPGTRDAVVHGTSGVLVDDEDELVDQWVALASDTPYREQLAVGARQRGESFSWYDTVDRFEEVLFEAVARAAGTGTPTTEPAAAAPAAEPPARATSARRRPLLGKARETAELFRLFLREKHEPGPFYVRLADRSVAELGLPLAGRRILDLGCGPGHFTEALRRAGAEVHPLELDAESLLGSGEPPRGAVQGDASVLPFADGTFDGIFCSNMLEHTPSPGPVLAEVGRVLRPGGWAWVSWTNWYSPWGGHEIVPFHYLGPERGLRAWRRLYGEPRKNVPFVELWPTHIGSVLRTVAAEPTLDLRDTKPRYYPSQRWITKIPGFREVFTWNCVLVLERTADPALAAARPTRDDLRAEAVPSTVIDLRDLSDGLVDDRAAIGPRTSSA